MIESFPDERYDVILADPPWRYSNYKTQQWAVADKFYPTLADTDLLSLPVQQLLKPTSVMFLWATGPRLDFAIDCLRAWGLYYRGVSFVWVKTKKDGFTPIGAQGVRPSIVKPTTEFVLAGSVAKSGRPMQLASESVRQVVLAPRTEHSEKPPNVQGRIEDLYPTATKLEMFARNPRSGWDAWGNEVTW